MSLRQYIIIMTIATVLCWVSLGFVVINVDPFEATMLSFGFFYISLYFALVGTISLLIFIVYKLFSSTPTPMFHYVQKSFLGALFTAAFLTILLYLQGTGLLNLWNIIIFIIALISLSIFLFFNKKVI